MGDIKGITDWESLESLVNKPLLTSDGIEVGIISSVQPEKIVVSHGPISIFKPATKIGRGVCC
jgi:hypothetical protein